MFYVIILLIWLAELIILPFCGDTNSILIISAPYFITLPIILSTISVIPLIFQAFLSFTGIIVAIIIVYQFITEIFYS
ncbi:MAG: hypothetical protein GF329_11320 [Candidatus Lokiarchaeota archaeon]|nr:hypothetical protein [Candidatus Lokiarchaeota archaeon]